MTIYRYIPEKYLGDIALPNATKMMILASTFLVSLSVPAWGATDCSVLTKPGLFDHTTISSATMVVADPAKSMPAYCEVKGTVSPVPESHIGVVYRLPTDWNGKMIGLGGGGFAGNVTMREASPYLADGYAIAQTDAGHPSPNGADSDWVLKSPGDLNKAQVVDFGYRAVHEMTKIGKMVIAAHYGRPQSKAYFIGCSTGGRMGLMEVQRYPDDYIGVVAGAPVNNVEVYISGIMRTQFFHKKKGDDLTVAQTRAVAAASMAACDEADGIKDGIITDPRTCKWDPAALKCGKIASKVCLTPQQITTVRNAYSGVTLPNGIVAADPILHGAELNWIQRSIGTKKVPLGSDSVLASRFVTRMMLENPNYDIMKFNPQKEMPRLLNSFAARKILAVNPDILPFIERGGKLVLWHGFDDPGPSPLETIKYFDAVARTVGPQLGHGTDSTAIGQSVRLFLAPGVYHCGGGPGVSKFDAAGVIDNWVERGKAPQRIIASHENPPMTRPLCPYPALPYYSGHGSTADPASFVCRGTGHLFPAASSANQP